MHSARWMAIAATCSIAVWGGSSCADGDDAVGDDTGDDGGSDDGGAFAGYGAYELVDDTWGHWAWIRLDGADGVVSAIVAGMGNCAYEYNGEVDGSHLRLWPAVKTAIGSTVAEGWNMQFRWKEISLGLSGGALDGSGSAWLDVEKSQGDEGYTYDVEDAVSVAEAPSAALEGSSDAVLPWQTGYAVWSLPVVDIAPHLGFESGDWTAADTAPASGGLGVREVGISYHGEWDAVRGRDVTFTYGPGIVDLGGAPATEGSFQIGVTDIGPAVTELPCDDPAEVWHSGNVEKWEEGDCAALGCLALSPSSMIAGQIDATSATQLVVTLEGAPDDWSVVVAVEGGGQQVASSGFELQEDALGELTIATGGASRLGFQIQVQYDPISASDNPLIVESIRAE